MTADHTILLNPHRSMYRSTLPVAPENAADFGTNVGWDAVSTSIVFTALATVVVALRWYTRSRLVRCIGWDDYVILLSMVFSWSMCALVGAQASEAVGVSSADSHHVAVAKIILVNTSIWTLTVNLTKASILAQYLRLFRTRGIRKACFTLLIVLVIAGCYGFFVGLFLCQPVAKAWNPELPGQCLSGRTYWNSVTSLDIILDFVILGLPIPTIVGLQMHRKQKIAIVLVFLLGFTVCIISIVRLAVVTTAPPARHFAEAIIWSSVEANVGIVCASVLALRALVANVFPKLADETKTPGHSSQTRQESKAGDVKSTRNSQFCENDGERAPYEVAPELERCPDGDMSVSSAP